MVATARAAVRLSEPAKPPPLVVGCHCSTWPTLRLASDGLGRRPDLLGAAEVALLHRLGVDGPQVVVELVDQRLAGGDVELHDVVVADVVEVLDQGPKAVAVGADQHRAPGAQVGGDQLVPVGEQPVDDVLEALGRAGSSSARQLGVAFVVVGVERVVVADRRRRHVVAAAPDLDLLGAVALGRLRLVAAGEVAVVALVEAPVAPHRDPRAPHRAAAPARRCGSPASAATCGRRRARGRARP